MKIERDERRFDFHDIGLAIKRAREASGMTQEQLAYIVDRAPRTIMYNENDGQRNGGCVRRTRGLRFFAPCSGSARNGKQFGWGHTPKFLQGTGPAKMLVGELPKPAGLRDKLSQSPGALHRSLRPVAIAPGPCGNQERVLFQLFLYIFPWPSLAKLLRL